ncbi:MAG: phosphoribosylformylglycinamidine synthase subunit PurS [Armatimonadetes bacterium]|nr:phosphoribosylformylglycinamidine synthase subunit PurS [Armatimonadota bacterium]
MAKVEITIQLKPTLMDAQGATINKALHNLGYDNVKGARIGKFIELEVEGEDVAQIEAQVREMCEKLLANPIIEDYQMKAITGNPQPEVREPRAAYAATPRVEDWQGFHLSVDDYEKLSVEERGQLHGEFQRLHGDWIQQQMQERGAKWILVAEGEVVDCGFSWKDCPNSLELEERDIRAGKLHWLFEKLFLIEESPWTRLGERDAYPSLRLAVSGDKESESFVFEADFDSGSSLTALNAEDLSIRNLLPKRPFRTLSSWHLGQSFEYTILPFHVELTDVSTTSSSSIIDCMVIFRWEGGPFTRINPCRKALAGRNLLLDIPASIELDGTTRQTRITEVKPR